MATSHSPTLGSLIICVCLCNVPTSEPFDVDLLSELIGRLTASSLFFVAFARHSFSRKIPSLVVDDDCVDDIC